ncbi:MAG: ABC transporter substrate-binding protein [Holophagaceae bacterium]
MRLRWLLGWMAATLLWGVPPISIALDKPVMSLNPLLLSREVEVQVVDLVFDRLVALDEHGEFVPQLLEGWEISPDGRNVLLKLRPGLTWQDGTPIEAEDIVETWRLLSLPQVRKINDLVGVRTLDSLVAEGPHRVRIRLKSPRASLLSDLYNFQPVPRRHYARGAGELKHPLNHAPIGSGPYRVLPGAHATEIQLQLWSGYHGSHPGRWGAFRFRVQPPDKAEYGRQLKAGEYHFGELDWFRHYLLRRGAFGGGNLIAQSTPLSSFSTFWFNCNPQRSLLGDVRLRRALAEALPWEFLKGQRGLRAERLASSLWPPQSWAFDQAVAPLPRAGRAAALLDEAGWKLGPDGFRRDARGRPLRLVMFSAWGYSSHDHADAFCEALRKVGVEIDLRRTPVDEPYTLATKGEGDIWDYAWNTGLDPDNESPLFSSDGIASGSNVTGYRNPDLDRLFEQGRHELDPVRRRDLYLRINQGIQSDRPVLQLTYGVAYLVLDRRLRGIGYNRLGQTYGYVPGRRGWWLEGA